MLTNFFVWTNSKGLSLDELVNIGILSFLILATIAGFFLVMIAQVKKE